MMRSKKNRLQTRLFHLEFNAIGQKGTQALLRKTETKSRKKSDKKRNCKENCVNKLWCTMFHKQI